MISMARPKKDTRRPSGEHEAVKDYRNKLASVSENTGFEDLDARLSEYLREVKTPLPPKP